MPALWKILLNDITTIFRHSTFSRGACVEKADCSLLSADAMNGLCVEHLASAAG